MKKFFLILGVSTAFFITASAQKTPAFTAAQQTQIKQILGADYKPVFSSKGELAIATPASVGNVRALPGGGFSKGPSTVANNILIHSGWILATSKQVLDAMKSKLGAERFKQLETVMQSAK